MKKTNLLLAALLLPLIAHAQAGKVGKAIIQSSGKAAVSGAATEQVTRNAIKTAVTKQAAVELPSAELTQTARNAALRQGINYTEKPTSHALINGKVLKDEVSPYAGDYRYRSMLEYDSEQGSIFDAMDQWRLDVGIQNWDKRIIDPIEAEEMEMLEKAVQDIRPEQRAVYESIDSKDVVPYKPLYESHYPSGLERSVYQDAYREISQSISSKDVIETGMDVSPATKEEYRALFTEMEGINYRMANQIQRMLRGQEVPYAERESLSSKISEVESKMASFQTKLFTPASGILQTRRNIDVFSKALIGKPAPKISWENPVPYTFSAFSLPYSISTGVFAPTEYQFSEVAGTLREKPLVAQMQQQLPPDLRIAVLNDDHMVPDAFKAARTLPQSESMGIGATQTHNYFPEGFKIEHYNNVQDFLAAHAQEPFDMIFTDWIFPGGGGDMVLKELRGAGDATPLIFNSKGNMSPAAVQKLYREGYSAHMPVLEEFEPSTAFFAVRDYFLNAQEGKLMPLLRFKPTNP